MEKPKYYFFPRENLIVLQIYLYYQLLRKVKYFYVIPPGRSFMKSNKKRGPNTDPSGTEFILLQSDI